MIKIAICDDDASIAESIESHLIALSAQYKKMFDVDVYYSGQKLGTFFKEQKYDLFLLTSRCRRSTGSIPSR